MSMADIKELRERTGAGMMDCKTALDESNGDIEKAIEWLREKGAAKAAKKAGRIAAEGLIGITLEGNSASLVEVNTETDFVAINVDFQKYVQEVSDEILKSGATDVEGFLADKWQGSEKTVEEILTEKIATIGEKITIRRFAKMNASNGTVVSYMHNGGKIGVIVEVESDNVTEEIKTAAKNVAMQIAAINPLYLTRDMVSEEYIAKEKEIIIAQIKEEEANKNKPDNIIEKMVEGKITKQLKEVCLFEQAYVKDPDLTVAKYVESVAKQTGSTFTIKQFVRYEAGEGIEKKVENFAEEVAKQINGNA